ncbi:cryptochrome/photolyase family protein [Lysobacter humi (ex Lee et al. 2017)]
MHTAIVWFRDDLRLDDNPALRAAVESGAVIVPAYVHDPASEGDWAPGAASNAWRARSLRALAHDLQSRGAPLRVFRGDSLTVLAKLAAATGATAVHWNRRYEPVVAARDVRIAEALAGCGIEPARHRGALLFEPDELRTGKGTGFRVFTPFWRAARARWALDAHWPAPMQLPGTSTGLAGSSVGRLYPAPRPAWDRGFWDEWTPGEAGAREALDTFVDGALRGYATDRDRPDRTGTSLLSPHLRFGELAPWRVAARIEAERGRVGDTDVDAYVRQLGWREFSVHLMHHAPQSVDSNLDPRFDAFEWTDDAAEAVDAWRRGRTGVPIIDAGMRQLWATGWMHGRVRMLVASYLCKHLRVHWRTGAEWFWDTLVDADLANNSMGWQWVAGTGADAAPYFRIFNPVTQALKFDPQGAYVARWVPELAALPVATRHAPWTDPVALARVAPDYPRMPIVDLAAGRDAALTAYRRLRGRLTEPEQDRDES